MTDDIAESIIINRAKEAGNDENKVVNK